MDGSDRWIRTGAPPPSLIDGCGRRDEEEFLGDGERESVAVIVRMGG